MQLRIISAGAGSGKTYRLTSEMVELLKNGVRASGIIATTFTQKAAAELQERVRVRLLEEGLSEQADALSNALIGTVHGLGVKLLQRFAFEAGVSPQVDIIADEDAQVLFNQSLATVLTRERVEKMEALCDRLGLHKKQHYDWRREVKQLTDVARANDFSEAILETSKSRSFEHFKAFLGEVSDWSNDDFHTELKAKLETTIQQIEDNPDETKKTRDAVSFLKQSLKELELRGQLFWHQWVKISKLGVGAKSKEDVASLKEFAASHTQANAFQEDIRQFIEQVFDISIAALREYDQYKKSRGLIDYTDMEVLIKRLLENDAVRSVLAEELDLLMVDEFQDTSPLQLEIFLKLSKIARYSIWVGDPKQSIYGFRGAEPRLMQAVIKAVGGVKEEDIQTYSWRSREDVVYCTNALFCKAFSQIPAAQVALKPKRRKMPVPDSLNKESEPMEMEEALMHWHFRTEDGGKRLPGKPWMENCIATTLRSVLEGGVTILPKGEKSYRLALPGDVAVLCRSNAECATVAEALHQAGLKVAISRSGLLATAEAVLIMACLKYLLNRRDSLSVAEILLLGSGMPIEDIIEDRLKYLKEVEQNGPAQWAAQYEMIAELDKIRPQVVDLSSAELLDLVLEEMDLRSVIRAWGNVNRRLDNVDVLRKLALQYEEACNRMHSSASLGGFLLWLNELQNNDKDMQASGEGPDTVNVMTYHRGKGLEWPIVICHSLEGNLRADVWGVHIESEQEEVDLENVLGNRWLRYWVNPYADQFRNTTLEAKLKESEAQAKAKEEALQEEARLLYVGITRARDYLVFPTRDKPTKWVNRVWQDGQEDYPTLDADTFETPWEWEKQILYKKTEVLIYPKTFPHTEMENEEIEQWVARNGKKVHRTEKIDLRKQRPEGIGQAKCVSQSSFSPAIPLKADQDQYIVSKAIKAFLNAERSGLSAKEVVQMAEGILKRYKVDDIVDARALYDYAGSYQKYLGQYFPAKRIWRKYPVRSFYKDQIFETLIDLLIETDQGLVIIQNSGFAGEEKKLKNKALGELGDWFFLARQAIEDIFGNQSIRTLVHFVMKGVLIEVETEKQGV